MNRSRCELFAGPAFPADEDGRRGRTHLVDEFDEQTCLVVKEGSGIDSLKNYIGDFVSVTGESCCGSQKMHVMEIEVLND